MDCNKLFNIVFFSDSDIQQSSQSIEVFPREPKYSDLEEDNMAQKEIFNSAMKTLYRHFPTLNSQISLLWESLS